MADLRGNAGAIIDANAATIRAVIEAAIAVDYDIWVRAPRGPLLVSVERETAVRLARAIEAFRAMERNMEKTNG